MNILFVNYGDFTANSLNHIAGFTAWLTRSGHCCAVAVPEGIETLGVIADPQFRAVTYAEALAGPQLFADGRGADLIHAWTPREGVRRFVLAYQKLSPAKLLVHLEDNEEYLIEAFGGKPVAELRDLPEQKFPFPMVDGLSHPVRYHHLLRIADGVTHIVDRLTEFIPAGTPRHLLPPGIEPLYITQPADFALRDELGLRPDEKVITFTGSVTFANAGEVRTLYKAVRLLNASGTPTRLIRTGLTLPDFVAQLGFDPAPFTIELGFVEKSKLPRLLALADVLVQPGLAGPFNDYRLPSKLPEFLASGRPVVLPASNVGRELADGREALLLREGTAEEIAATCARVFADPALATALGHAAADFARRHFDLATNSAALLAFYERMLALPANPAWSELAHFQESDLALQIACLRNHVAAQPTTPEASATLAWLDDLRGAARQLDADLQERAGTIADLRQHAFGLEEARDILQQDIATVRAHAAEHARQLETANHSLQQDIAAVRAHAAQHALQLETENQKLLHDAAAIRAHAAEHARQLETANYTLQQDIVTVRTQATEHALQLETQNQKLLHDIAAIRAHAAEHTRQLETANHSLRQDIAAVRSQAAEHARQLEMKNRNLRDEIAAVRAHAAEHTQQLETENRKLQASVTHVTNCAREVSQAAEREVLRLQHELHETQYRVQRMSASFSWRATSWLRALRRKFIDPRWALKPPPPPPFPDRLIRLSPGDLSLLPPAPAIRCHLDAPRSWPKSARDLMVRGWVFVENEKRSLQSVRARVGGRLYTGQFGLPRPDVGLNFKAFAGANHSGFKVLVTIEENDAQVLLETEDAAGFWHVFYTYRLGDCGSVFVPGSYNHWVMEHDTVAPATLEALARTAERWHDKPVIALVMPVYNTPERWLTHAIDSVRAQAYPHWELCIADDASPQPHVRSILERYAAMDHRIKVAWRTKNGHISAATNSALELVTAKFTGLLDHDDELAPHALYCIAQEILAHPDAEVIYTDEDKIDESGTRFDPHFKPAWNPDLLDSQNYLSHLTVYRTETLRAAGGLRKGFEGAQDWDLALRITEKVPAGSIRHIPRVLYHWRAIEGSTATQLQEKDYTVQAAHRALEEHFARIGARVELKLIQGGHWRPRRLRPDPAPLVTLVIPTRNRRELLVKCIESIREKTAYPNFEFLIADNDSDDPELHAFYEKQKAVGRFTVVACPGPFNYSAINNRAVAQAKGELVGLLNNDLEAIHPEWLDELVAHALRPEIGCVGAKLYYADRRIQHAGVITGLGGVAGHAFKGFTHEEPGTPQFRPHLLQNLSAVTAACLLVRKRIYEEVGGLDEHGLTVAFNDVDFCLKVQARGYRNLFTPFAELLHHESASRGAEDSPEKIRRFQSEIACIKERWGDSLLTDPAYNPNLSLDSEDWALAYPPRVPPLHNR